MPLASIVRSLELVNNAAALYCKLQPQYFTDQKGITLFRALFLESPTLDCDCSVFFGPNVNQFNIANGSKMFCKQWLFFGSEMMKTM